MDILIAEDDRVGALRLRRILEKMEHRVEVVDNGLAAWRRVAEGGVRFLICDWMMPQMDGLEVCRRIRAGADGLYTYIILLSARDGRDDRLAGLEAGADDYLTKPVDTTELIARLNVARRILNMQEELRANAAQLGEVRLILERQNAALAELAFTDGLTGLKNIRYFREILDSSIKDCWRGERPLSLVMLDIDHFKGFNDNHGHPAGDQVLRSVARILQGGVRHCDVVGRYGGEEFAVILPDADEQAAQYVAERLRASIAEAPWPLRQITASFGVATLGPDIAEAADLIKQADLALYESKRQGRNRVILAACLQPV